MPNVCVLHLKRKSSNTVLIISTSGGCVNTLQPVALTITRLVIRLYLLFFIYTSGLQTVMLTYCLIILCIAGHLHTIQKIIRFSNFEIILHPNDSMCLLYMADGSSPNASGRYDTLLSTSLSKVNRGITCVYMSVHISSPSQLLVNLILCYNSFFRCQCLCLIFVYFLFHLFFHYCVSFIK